MSRTTITYAEILQREAERQIAALRRDPTSAQLARVEALPLDERATVAGLLARMGGGYGEFVDPAHVAALWSAFSEEQCASWLILSDLTVGDFLGWLVERTRSGVPS